MIKRLRSLLDLQKPSALSWGDWQRWHAQTQDARPYAYFITETIPDAWRTIHRRVTQPFNNMRSWLRYRLFDRMHVIRTGLDPGYHDADERMLHGMFNLLVDYVEVELAWMHVVFDKQAREKYRHPWWSLGWTRFKSFRNPEAGMAHLRWEMTLDSEALLAIDRNPHQAQRAREIWQLYHWWKNIRPLRPDPHDASGWSEYCTTRSLDDLFGDDQDDEEKLRSREMIDTSREIEDGYNQEDEAMLIRLVKIRKYLWT